MSTSNGISYSDVKNLGLRGTSTQNLGILRWAPESGTGWTTNPVDSSNYGLYINSAGQLIFSSLGSTVNLSTGGGAGSFNLPVSATDGSTTIGTSLLLNDSALTTGNAVQAQVATGVFTTGGRVFYANMNAVTAGNGFVAVTTGVYSGTGLLVLTANSATTGVISAISATGLTSGNLLTLTAGTTMTTAGALLLGTITGAAGSAFDISITGVYTDATGIEAITANSLTTGSMAVWSATGQTSGVLFSVTGGGSNITSSGIVLDLELGAAIAGTGLKVLTSGVFAGSNNLALFSANSATTTTGIVSITGTGLTTGVGLLVTGGGSNFTTGSAISVVMGAAVAGTGLKVVSTGILASGTGDNGLINVTGNSATTTTGLVQISGTGLTSGQALLVTGGGTNQTSTNPMVEFSMGAGVTGIGLEIITTGAYTGVSGNGLLNITANSATTTAGLVQVFGNGLTTGTMALFSSTGVITGNLLSLVATGLTTGTALNLGVLTALTTGIGIGIAHTTSVIATTGALLSISSSSVDTSGHYLANFVSTGSTGGTAVSITATNAGQLTNTLLSVVASGYTTGYTGNVVAFTGVSTTGASNVLLLTGANTSAGAILALANNALTTGFGITFAHTTSVIASGGSLLNLSSTSIDTSTTTGSLLNLSSTASTAGTQVLLTASALTTGIGLSIQATALTTGSALLVTGGGSNMNASTVMASFQGGAATAGQLLQVFTSGVYTDTSGVATVTANAATSGVILKVAATGLTSGTALQIRLAAATLTTGFYFAATDGGLNVFTVGANGHLTSNQTTAPTIGVGTQNGITAAAITAGSTDVNGNITTTGTSTGGTIFTVTFNKTYTVAPKIVIITPANANAAAPNTMPFVSSITATTFVVTVPSSGTYAATPSYNYLVIA